MMASGSMISSPPSSWKMRSRNPTSVTRLVQFHPVARRIDDENLPAGAGNLTQPVELDPSAREVVGPRSDVIDREREVLASVGRAVRRFHEVHLLCSGEKPCPWKPEVGPCLVEAEAHDVAIERQGLGEVADVQSDMLNADDGRSVGCQCHLFTLSFGCLKNDAGTADTRLMPSLRLYLIAGGVLLAGCAGSKADSAVESSTTLRAQTESVDPCVLSAADVKAATGVLPGRSGDSAASGCDYSLTVAGGEARFEIRVKPWVTGPAALVAAKSSYSSRIPIFDDGVGQGMLTFTPDPNYPDLPAFVLTDKGLVTVLWHPAASASDADSKLVIKIAKAIASKLNTPG